MSVYTLQYVFLFFYFSTIPAVNKSEYTIKLIVNNLSIFIGLPQCLAD